MEKKHDFIFFSGIMEWKNIGTRAKLENYDKIEKLAKLNKGKNGQKSVGKIGKKDDLWVWYLVISEKMGTQKTACDSYLRFLEMELVFGWGQCAV